MGNLITVKGFETCLRYAELFKQGLIVTVLLAFFTVIIGFVLGITLAIIRMSDFRPFRFLGVDKDGHLRGKGILLTISKFNPLSFLATCYVEVIRSTPVKLQKSNLDECLEYHKGGIAWVDQGENLSFQLKAK
jgi:polar amino acid transport system permease protein